MRNIQYALNHTRFIREQENLGFITEQPNGVSVLFQNIFFIMVWQIGKGILFQEFLQNNATGGNLYIHGDLLMVKLLIIFPFICRERFSLQDFTPLERLWPQQDLIDWFVSLYISTGDKCFVIIIIITSLIMDYNCLGKRGSEVIRSDWHFEHFSQRSP